MSKKEIAIVNICKELEQCTVEEYEAFKPVLLAVSADIPHLVEFLEKVFALVEMKSPKLIEMKEGATV